MVAKMPTRTAFILGHIFARILPASSTLFIIIFFFTFGLNFIFEGIILRLV